MEQKFSKGSWQWNFFQEYWKFVQKYYIPEDTDEWWEEVDSESKKLKKKYGNTQFVRDLIMAHMNKLERKSKQNGSSGTNIQKDSI